MATTLTPSTQFEQKYRQNYWSEYVRNSGFIADMGASEMSIIHTAMEAVTSGRTIHYPLLTRLTSGGTYGSNKLIGREEALGKHEFAVTVEYRRHAVELSRREEHFDYAKVRERVSPVLKEWSMDQLRRNIVDGLAMVAPGKVFISPQVPGDSTGSTTYVINAAANTSELNTWATVNGDWTNAATHKAKARILYGNSRANTAYTSGVVQHATSLANVTSSMKLTTGLVSTYKRIAKKSDPHIRPIRVGEQGREYYKMYVGSEAFRDLKNDPAMLLANESARPREGNGVASNPIFQDGDLEWDGVIIKEIPEIPVIAGAGASSIDVAPVFLCGAQAVAVGWGQYPRFTKKSETDYEFFDGIGIEEALGCGKFQRTISSNVIDNGIVTGFVSGVSDS